MLNDVVRALSKSNKTYIIKATISILGDYVIVGTVIIKAKTNIPNIRIFV